VKEETATDADWDVISMRNSAIEGQWNGQSDKVFRLDESPRNVKGKQIEEESSSSDPSLAINADSADSKP